MRPVVTIGNRKRPDRQQKPFYCAACTKLFRSPPFSEVWHRSIYGHVTKVLR